MSILLLSDKSSTGCLYIFILHYNNIFLFDDLLKEACKAKSKNTIKLKT